MVYQDGHCAHYRLEWKENIRGFLGNFDRYLCCSVCRLPTSMPRLINGAIARRGIEIAERGADGESDGGR